MLERLKHELYNSVVGRTGDPSPAEHMPVPWHGLQLYLTKSCHQAGGTLNSGAALLGALNFVACLCFQHKCCAAIRILGTVVYPLLSYLILFGKSSANSSHVLFIGKTMCTGLQRH